MAIKKKTTPEPVKKPVPAVKEKASVPSTDVLDFSADAGKGMEGADKSAFAIPFLILLQTNSPQLETNHEAQAVS